ncbi:MAG: hypothetical protein PHX18_08225 [Candidatus Gastranaerophilales bacterium]|nr:hypothetical protein [Candidatus Gastranaerophilales bacterium]
MKMLEITKKQDNLEKFSPEVAAELKYYVYRLIDPRNGQTFYVGKGKNNRVFAHALDALKSYENEKYFNNEGDEDDISIKIKTVREIRNAGLNVLHVIHRWGLEEKEAFEVESAVIDCYPGLTNLQSGHNSDRGVANAITIESTISRKCYDEPEDINYIIIKTSQQRVEDCGGSLYDATRGCWKINKANAEKCKYILSVIDGIVKEVYEVHGWHKSPSCDNRSEFDGIKAPDNIRNIFIEKRIPAKYRMKGSANPVTYKK